MKYTDQELNKLVLMKVAEELRAPEASLLQTKWWDYRVIDPARATLLFADTYRAVYGEKYAEYRDLDTAESARSLVADDIFDSPELGAIWRARQAADLFGIPYEFMLRFAFDRCITRGWRFFPRPNQLYDAELGNDCQEHFQYVLNNNMRKAVDPFFQAPAYVGHPQQDAYYTWLCTQVMKRAVPMLSVAWMVFKSDHMPVTVAERLLPARIIVEAREYAGV